MKILIGLFTIIGILVVLFFIALIIKNYKKIKRDTSGGFREFNDAPELIAFIRNLFKCVKEHNIVMFGFVESTYQNNILQKNGISDEPHLDVNVMLITKNGHEKVNTTCSDIYANLKKGDFVAVLPIYNQRHDFWYYITIAKLNATYLGRDQGFSVQEEYLD